MEPMVLGIEPVNELRSRYSDRRLVMSPMVLGIVPDREFDESINAVSACGQRSQ